MFNFSPSAFLCFLLYPKTKVSLQKKKTLNNTRKAYKNSLYTLMKKLIVFLILFLQSFYLFPARTVKVTPILTLPQLPVSAIHRIFQDSQGYMWYGTVNGLCQDDGYRLRVFRSDINAEKIMENNIIQSIAEDAKGRIWFGCDQGAYILNKQDGQITPLDPKRLGTLFISHIRRTSDGMMWITAGNALIRYNSEGLFQQSYPLYDYNQKSSWMTGFCESRQKEIFITVKRGDILRYDKKKDNFFLYAKAPARKNLTYIIQDRAHDYFWIGTESDGVVLFNPSATRDSLFTYSPLPVNSMGEKEGNVLYLAQDDTEGWLWMTTRSDLIAMKYNEKTKQLQQADFQLPPSGRMLNEIFKDKNGALWVASFDRESFMIHFVEDAPKEYNLPALKLHTNFQPAIMALCDAGEHIFWISQERTGLGLYDLDRDRMSLFSDFSHLASLALHSVKQISSSRREGNVWVIPENQNFAYELSRKGMQIYLKRTVKLNDAKYNTPFTQTYEDTQGTLWIGTHRGLHAYHIKDGDCKTVCDTLGTVSAIKEDKNGVIYVSTLNKGVYRVTRDGKYTHLTSPSSVTCLAIDDNETLWMGTQEGGVYAFTPFSGKLTNHTQLCGLNGDIINQLATDAYGHLWIGMNQKIIEYNPNNHSFSTYLTTDGSLKLRRFIPTALCEGHDRKLYFGGIPGICAVTPSGQLDRKSGEAQTLITKIYIMGKEMNQEYKQLILQPDEYDLQLFFSSLNYLNAQKIRYAYRLLGLEEQWNYTTDGDNTAIYKHLPKGNYTFEVKATDNYGIWSNQITRLNIKRLPAFYETRWAIFFYIILGAGLIACSIWIYIRRINRKNEELYADSEELIKMRNYLTASSFCNNENNAPDSEYSTLNKLLLQKATQTIEQNLEEPDFDVNRLAAGVGVSRSTLTRKLKALTGRTPLEFIHHIKMQHARRLLEGPNQTVSEVALTLGYFNRKHFTACFKEEFGVTPSEYHKKSIAEGKDLNQKGDDNG